MTMLIKKSREMLFVSLVLLVFAALMPVSYCSESSANEQAILFLSEVALIDQSKQNVTLEAYSVNPFDSAKEDVAYTIESNGTHWDAMFQLKNGRVTTYSLRIGEGSALLYSQLQSAEVLDDAKNFLRHYYSFTKNTGVTTDAELEKMLESFDTMTELEATNKMVGDNLRFEAICAEKYTEFNWVITINGADYSKIGLTFGSSCFTFMDNRGRYEIGNTDVDVTKDEAVNVALKAVEDYSYTVNGTEISGFNIAEDVITAELFTRPNVDSLLQPYWCVDVGLEELYPGNIYSIRVNVWAGTGDVIESYGLGFGGSLPQDSDSDDAATETTSENITGTSIDNILLGTVVAAAVCSVIVAIVIKQKRK